jgi:hypothetical protein
MLLVSAAVVALLGRPAAGVVAQISSPDARAPAPNVSQFNPRFDSPSASGPVRIICPLHHACEMIKITDRMASDPAASETRG